MLAFTAAPAYALQQEHYAASSVLASGKWVKVKVTGTGMHLVTAADLRKCGFTNPEKVRVYGTGGRMLREELSERCFDDLPMQPSMLTARGIIFFGTDNISWRQNYGRTEHEQNPYALESYYFLSDRDAPELRMPQAGSTGRSAGPLTEFKARVLHENDMQMVVQGGRLMMGEDFSVNQKQVFKFDMPGKTSNNVMFNVFFGAKTLSGGSKLTFEINGAPLKELFSNRIPSDCQEEFIGTTSVVKQVSMSGESLSLGVDFKSDGKIETARLDYIEVIYSRALNMNGGELYFYDEYTGTTSVAIAGASETTCVWEVTDPVNIREVKGEVEDGVFHFLPDAGYHEYMAFEPARAGRTAAMAGKVTNQDIHSMPVPDMVIISPREYAEGSEKIAQLHRDYDGFAVTVLDPQHIYNEFSGGHPDVMAFRKLLKMWHDRPDGERLAHCLLMGRGSYDSRKLSSGTRTLTYQPLPMWQSPKGRTLSDAFSTDDIIGMLDDCDEESFKLDAAQMQVAVGRLPVRSAAEAMNIAGKIEKYIKGGNFGSWRNKVMLIADDQNRALHLDQSETVYQAMKSHTPSVQYDRVYLDSYQLVGSPVGMTYPEAKNRVMRNWNDGVVLTNYVGHGAPTSWTHEKLLTWSDITSFTNPVPSFLYAATCAFGYWDADAQSGCELMVLQPKGGFIGAIVPSRSVFMGPNGTLNQLMARWMLTREDDGRNITIGEVYRKAKNAYVNDNKLRFCLMTDPALRLPIPEMQVRIESINDVSIDGVENFPEIPALGTCRIKGRVCNPDGSLASDFTGTIELDLYDAEIPIETNGNGNDGEVRTYNDRKMRLNRISAKVVNGEWCGEMHLPSEIENNYSPARVVAYAWSDAGKQAHGHTEQLYVYGYQTGVDDTDGPEISGVRLNFTDYRDGITVNANPVLHAVLTDASGVNISDAGIGHRMSITLDKGTVYNDVSAYFSPDPDNNLAGSVAYPLSGLTAGEHTLTLSVYDNVGNLTTRDITFTVGETMDPVVRNLAADRSPARTGVTFTADIDTPNTRVKCTVEVYDLAGRKVWSSLTVDAADINGQLQAYWNLRDAAGKRVPRGIYLYRVQIETMDGRYTSASQKLAVAAP